MNSRSGRFVKQFINFLVLASILAYPLAARSANPPQVGQELRETIEQAVLKQWLALGQREDEVSKVKITGLPAAYKTPQCAMIKVVANKQLVLGRNSIQVSCQQKSSWSLMLNADIEVWRPVVVLRDHINRGEKIQLSHLTLQQRNLAKLQRGYFKDLKQVTGNISKRSLKAGTAVNPSMINLPIIVERGQRITLRVQHPGLAVNMKGIALKKGRKGDSIKVKNSSSNRVLYGTIIHSDLVLIN
jgi:flagella basal body P-ring formation protein FlgA